MRRARGLLTRTARTWAVSPLRRSIQAVCLAAFLVLFFYVAFPYTARPAKVSGGWLPIDVDSVAQRVTLTTDPPAVEAISRDEVLHLINASASPPQPLGVFRVVEGGDRRVILEPAVPWTPEQFDRLGESFGPWSLGEDEPGSWPSHYARDGQRKAKLPAESFLFLDPLANIAAALAARAWVASLAATGAILLVCLIVPRGFCGYACPMGTLLDLLDWAIGRRVGRPGHRCRGWWTTLKYVLLLGVLVAALFGVMIAGFVSAIPVVTRGLAFLFAPLQTGWTRGGHQVPPLGFGQVFSILLFLGIFALGFVEPRFWCKHVCPTGAVFSLANRLRLFERRVDARCTACGHCVGQCPFAAVEPDISTRTADCAFCRTCGNVCPTGAIRFRPRWQSTGERTTESQPTVPGLAGRRGFLRTTGGLLAGFVGGAAVAGVVKGFGPVEAARPPVRPPGSVPETQFLALCVRCGECYRACPNDALQPLGFAQGLDALWTPHLVADWSGCEPSCNLCGHVCPTAAIRRLPLEEKRAARIGLAVIDLETCLPHAGQAECQLCVDECAQAGYHAIEFVRVGTEVDDRGQPIEESGMLAPVVIVAKCVGCGLCQTRCRAINAVEKGLLHQSAIVIEAGEGKEDRLVAGSYVALRRQEQRDRVERQSPGGASYLPDWIP